MRRHFFLQRRILAVGVCLLLLTLLMASLGWVGRSPVQQVGDASLVGGEAVPSVVTTQRGRPSGRFDPIDAKRAVQEAWEQARDAGTYAFATDLAQVVYPALSLSSVGRGPERSELRMEGRIDQPARILEFRMGQPGGGASGEARIEGDRAYVRQAGGEWQEVEDFTGSFAPDNDPLAFLSGVKDISDCGLQARTPTSDPRDGSGAAQTVTNDRVVPASDSQVTCYRFNLDGVALASYLRDRLKRTLAEQGHLPFEVALDTPREFRDLTGSGELWVDGRGLPQRLSMHLAFPKKEDGSHLDADFQTVFSGFPEDAAASALAFGSDPVAWVGGALGLDTPSLPGKAARTAGSGGVLVLSLATTAWLFAHRRSRRLYVAVVMAVILSMVVVPLLQSERVKAFFDRQAAGSQDLMILGVNGQALDPQEVQEQEAARQAVANVLAPPWDPKLDPLAKPDETQAQASAEGSAIYDNSDGTALGLLSGNELDLEGSQLSPEQPALTNNGSADNLLGCNASDTNDSDGDGVSDYEECVYSTLSHDLDGDTDNDGLTDGQELNKLGTNPLEADTDGDLITDTVEVEGFSYYGQWYLDPNNPDTNGDGLIDSVDCPALVDPTAGGIAAACDTDGDHIPNVFEFDNDDDGVPDSVDLSPEESVDRTGVRVGQAGTGTAFSGEHPFLLSVTDLESNWPVFVELQLRPAVASHLAYAMNVLDWPAGDVDGQIQHGKLPDTTFATSNPDDTSGANGDMRLVPMLEIEMTGPEIPLRLAEPAITVTVGSGTDLSSTVTLRPASNPANTQFSLSLPDAAQAKIYAGPCQDPGTLLATFTGTSGTLNGKTVVQLADGAHSVAVTLGTASECTDLPDVVNGPYSDMMVDTSVLDPYGITVKDRYTADGVSVVAYVPLNITSDDTGGGRSAFQARMLYTVGEHNTWHDPQQVRVIWLVQMVTDSCADGAPVWEEWIEEHEDGTSEEFDEDFDAYCAANRTVDQVVPVQTYDESWYLTGLMVREDHGLDVAVAYVDPSLSALDPSAYDDDDLWTLSLGLGDQFMTGLDCRTDETWDDPDSYDPETCEAEGTGDEKRDLTVFLNDPQGKAIGNSTLEQRFDLDSTVPTTQRWGIDSLIVESFRYEHQDYLTRFAGTQTPRILNEYNHGVNPTVLLAREERYRDAGMEAVSMPAADGPLTLVLGSALHPERTLAGVQWTPYRYDGETADWEAYPTTEYWDILEVELEDKFYSLYPGDDAETSIGWVYTARAYSFALLNGLATTVVHCTPEQVLCPIPKSGSYSDDMIIKATKDLMNGVNAVTVKLIFLTLDARRPYKGTDVEMDLIRNSGMEEFEMGMGDGDLVERGNPQKSFLKELGTQFKSYVQGPYSSLLKAGPRYGKVSGGLVAGAAVAALIATVIVSCVLHIEGGQIAAVVIRSASLLVATHCALAAIQGAVKSATSFTGFMAKGWAARGLGKNIKGSGVIATVLQVLVTWAAFGALVASNHMVAGSMAFDNALAGAIADMIVAVVLFVIFTALGPIGTVLQALVGLVNAIANLICSALPAEMQTSFWGNALCRGITGIISNLFKRLLYSGTLMVDMDPKGYERLSLYGFDTQLVDEDAGVVDTNKMRYSIALTNTIDLVKTPINRFEVDWGYQFNATTLKSSNFAYKWQQEEEPFHSELKRGNMDPPWDTSHGRPYSASLPRVTSGEIPLPQAGINRPLGALYLSEAYAVPEQECWALIGCDIKTERATSHFDMGKDMIYDVLPSTLDGFYQLTSKGDGWALAWGQDGDLTFPTLVDADGDGLSKEADPNDSTWDTDKDGLSDAFELGNGTDPLLLDSDADGLSDLQEARFGSDPMSKDGDGDGLLDCQEVFHQVVTTGDSNAHAECGDIGEWSGGWTIVYKLVSGQRWETRVTSDPNDADSDSDGLTDAKEKVYGYNPRATSVLNVLSLESSLSEVGQSDSDGFVAPGQTLSYSATVANLLDNRQAEGLLWTEASPILDRSGLAPQPFILDPQAQGTMSGDLPVDEDAASGTYSLTQVAGALITDLEVESGGASLWLRFDDPSGSTAYKDSSGRVPTHDGWCAAGTCTLEPAGGHVGGGLKLDGTGYVRSNATLGAQGFSASFWFRVDAAHLPSEGVLFGNAWLGFGIYWSSGAICFRRGSDVSCIQHITSDTWHHIVLTDLGDGTNEWATLYVDGQAGAWVPSMGSLFGLPPGVWIGGMPGFPYLVGSIDDVRLFERVLPAQEVADMANQPVFHADFNDTSAWKDVSPFHLNPTCSSCPGHTVSGLSAAGASFNGTQYLTVPTSDHLDLGAGRFTLSAWIKPQEYGNGDPRDTFAQGIIGWHAGETDGYPSLERVGRKIRFGLGTGVTWPPDTGWLDLYTSGDVLTMGQWNHVALTLDTQGTSGTLWLYLNGEPVAGTPVVVQLPAIISHPDHFEIGRAGNKGSLYLHGYHCNDSGDTNVACKVQTNGSEQCMSIQDRWVWNEGKLECGDDGNLNIADYAFRDTVTLRLWEDDTDPQCGDLSNGKDQICTFGTASTLSWSTNRASVGDTRYSFSNCGSGYFWVTYTNKRSVPFHGEMDEVQVFAQPLDQDAIRRLFADPATQIHLPLDEAPGATAFQDTSLAQVAASCDGEACPASGTAGRLNQGAWFNGNDYVEAQLNVSESSYAVALWFKTSCTNCGIFSVDSGTRGSGGHDRHLYLSEGNVCARVYNNEIICTSAQNYADGQWHHLAHTFGGSVGGQKIYLDGVLKVSGKKSTSDFTLQDGINIGFSNDAVRNYFSGAIDDVWIFGMALPAAWIARLYESAPILHMRFDEAHGANQFADNASASRFGTCTGTACPLVGEAVRGQVGLAAQFDGVDDTVTIGNFGTFDMTAVSAWVYRTDATGVRETIVSYKESGNCGSVLALESLRPKFYVNVGGVWQNAAPSTGEIPLNQWVHLAGTYDGKTIRLYRNGVEVATKAAAGTMAQCTSAMAIGSRNSGNMHYFPGAIDQVRIYGRALTPGEIREQYLYENAWVENRQSQGITVDDDLPTAEILMAQDTYLPKQVTVVGVAASDPTSGVDEVSLSSTRSGQPPLYEPMASCADPDKGAWCAEFSPESQGVYTLRATVRDLVGNSGASPDVSVRVDDTPPELVLDQGSYQLLNGRESGGEKNTWVVHLSGTVRDPELEPSIAGSGVPADGVHVTLRDSNGVPLGDAGQTAILTPNQSGNVWSLDYAVGEAEPDGCYAVEVTAQDQVARTLAADSDQLASHTAIVTGWIALQTSAPKVALDWQPALANGRLGPAVTSLGGEATHRPVPVEVDLAATTGADQTRVWLTCQHGNEGSWYTLFDLAAGTLAAEDTREWEGEAHHWATCRVELTTSAPSGGVSGVVKVCGTEIASWDGNFAVSRTVEFVVHSDSCDAGGCPAPPPNQVSMLQAVGPQLHLPFELAEATDGTVLPDASGGGHDGTLHTGTGDTENKAVPGLVGAYALQFDGTNDYVEVPLNVSETAYGLSLWFKTSCADCGIFSVDLGILGVGGHDRHVYLSGGNVCARIWSDETICTSGRNYADGRWHHVVHTFGGTVGGQKIYLDGVLTASGTKASSDFVSQNGINIGFSNDAALDYFSGVLDDVMVYNQALSAEEVEDMFRAVWQGPPVSGVQGVDIAFRSVLPGSAFANEAPPAGEIFHLPFEDTLSGEGNQSLAQVAGTTTSATCTAGACPSSGQVGPSGSAAFFDGIDDTVAVGDFGTSDLTTVSAWVKRTGATTTRETIVSYKENQGCGFVLALQNQVPVLWLRVGGSWQSVVDGWGQIPLNQWVHLVGTYDGQTIRLYRNGVEVAHVDATGTMAQCVGPTAIGSRNDYLQHWFPGLIDEVRIFSRAVTAAEVQGLYRGSGPLLAFSFEEPWATDGTIVPDSSGWEQNGTLFTGTADAANKAVPGQAGSYSLQLDGVDDYVRVPDHDSLDFAHDQDFAVALWVKADIQVNTQHADNDIVEKWAGSGGYPYVIRYQRDAGTILAARYDGTYSPNVSSQMRIDDGQFHHVAFVKQGTTLYLYVDGVQRSAAPDTTTGDTTNASPLYIGRRGYTGNNFKGTVDDLRIYPRALQAPEVVDLYHAGWQAATLAQGGAGVDRTSWSGHVPSGLEGAYQVEMRGLDAAGHVGVEPLLLWRGEADNMPPRVTLTRTTDGNQYLYTTVAEDFYLADPAVAPEAFTSPCEAGVAVVFTTEQFQSAWYLGRTDRPKLAKLTANCTTGYLANPQATVCDVFGNCNTCDLAGTCTQSIRTIQVPGEVQGGENPAVALGDAPVANPSEVSPSQSAQPAISPQAGFQITAPAVVTTSHYYEPRTVNLDGLVTSLRPPVDGLNLASVRVSIGSEAGLASLSEPAASKPYTVTWTFPWQLPQGSALPDGVTYTATITATDGAGRTTVVYPPLVADVVPPAPVTATLTANGVPVEPGATIRQSPADLALAWTPSSDGSGLASYLAAWRFEDAYTTTVQTSLHDPDGTRVAYAAAGEAQRVSVGVDSRDVYGNARWQAFGSVIVDSPLTPDYISLSPGAEGDSTGSTCTLLGADRRLTAEATGGRWSTPRFYTTWDHQALRLTWTGGNWSGDGDLFLYLDTAAGGTDTTFFPYTVAPSGTLVLLPPDFQADALIWVRDTTSATLLLWDGSQWAADRSLSSEQYRFDGGRDDGRTDLYLPFSLLGLSAGSPLGLVAFAAEEPAPDIGPRIWATMPLANPANSSLVNRRRVLALPGISLMLSHAYRWAALDDGVCPNGTNGELMAEQHNDAWLQMTGESNPPTALATGAARGLFWVPDPVTALSDLSDSAKLGFLNPAQPPLSDGQVISYTVRYRNEGSHTLAGAWIALSAYGAIETSVDTVDLGDIPAGGEGSVTFQATVDRSLSPSALAAVLGRLYAATNGPDGMPLEWSAGLYRIDTGIFDEMGLHSSATLVGPGAGRLRGFARTVLGISTVELEITSPAGLISTLVCADLDRASGEWSCSWDATAANGGVPPADGEFFSVRLRATDVNGNTSPWSAAHTIRVDAQPPAIALSTEAMGIDPGRAVRGSRLRLIGSALDNDKVARVTVCLDQESCRTADLSHPGAGSSDWSKWVTLDGAMDYVTKTLTIRAMDRLGNSTTEPLTMPVVFDNVPPVLAADQILTQVPLSSTQTVLTGNVGDGSPRVEVSVRMQPPRGTLTRLPAARDGGTWWFDLPADLPGQYTLWADAEDLAGNVTTAGPFTVDVTCTNAAPVLTSLTAEPVAGWPLSLTLTVVISNAGPELLPAGFPIVVSEGISETSRLTTTVPLGPGESEALSLVWTPDGATDHAIEVTAGRDEVLPGGPLCVGPRTARFTVPVGVDMLYLGWNLISPPVNPTNPSVDVVQHGVDGDYRAIVGYDGGLLSYDPDRPGDSTLTTIDALHGYWIDATVDPSLPPTDTHAFVPVASWRMTGERLPEDRPLSLAPGWNLVGYLPQRPLTVTTALEGITGQYGAVLGFERTALSYYPDLDSSYNTLYDMAPGFGYWISATQALTFAYPTTTITHTLPTTATMMVQEKLRSVRLAEGQAGVQPTYEWANFYGPLSLPEATPVPTGTVVLAVDPQGVICGATMVWEPGQYGLLACYRDDPATAADEGALPGDVIQLFVSSDGTQPDGQFVGAGLWTGHGHRWQVEEGVLPLTNLTISKELVPQAALPGATITYTLAYTNTSNLVAQGVVILDIPPLEIEFIGYSSWGAPVTLTVGSDTFSWQVADLGPGEGGIITVTSIVSPALASARVLTNTAIITAPLEGWPGDNVAEAVLQVNVAPQYPWQIWLPLIERGQQ